MQGWLPIVIIRTWSSCMVRRVWPKRLTAYDRWWVTDPLLSDAPWLSIVDADRRRAFSIDGVAVALPGVDRQPKLAL